MYLTSVRIQHYKSLADVYMPDLEPLTLLVGANAVGKSNIVDALRFLRDIAVDGLDHALSTRGGIGIVRQYSPTRPFQIHISVKFRQTFNDGVPQDGLYEITLKSLKGGNYRVEYEAARWWEEKYFFSILDGAEEEVLDSSAVMHSFSRDAAGKTIYDSGDDDLEEFVLSPDIAALSRIRFGSLGEYFSSFRFSAIYPNTLRNPSRPDTDRALKESGENWASILKSLKKSTRGKQAFEQIKEMMQVLMPTLQDVTVKSVGGYLVPQFRVKDIVNSHAHDFDPVQMSDGTLRIFGILLALYQTPSPPFLALEEPEQTVHPGILATLAEAFREVSERTQIFVTSHSPHFVDFFDPEEIRVVTIKNGKTVVSPIRRTQMEAIKEHLISLEELMVSEGLLPEEI